ncbi:hypothetical protein FK498_01330 [Elioraea sp. Yellowstone]|jgi:hypothetical protein|uniref:hypothetical protein n=1 Tax=Elioraea sp. Yellowstone TaxID=2592070 RepID=UPI001150D5E9|nr:hypothetical protein [Elioraea sp. Yellowstone]TQF84854.1 hypothetical protein FK498_01330 [Elioraea sp. Yellowstone]
MSLLNKTADLMHRERGYFVSNGFANAECGSYGERDSHVYERLGNLRQVNGGVPDPVVDRLGPRDPRWFMDRSASAGRWQVGAAVPGGLVALSVRLTFSAKHAVACYLASYDEMQLRNSEQIGDALAELYRRKGNDWTLKRKWAIGALEVKSGFIVMSNEKDVEVTLTGTGTVSASGMPITFDLGGVQGGRSSSVEMIGLKGITPFVLLAEVKDGLFSKATWGPLG